MGSSFSLHDKLLKSTGELSELHDRGLLKCAVFGANVGFEDIEQYSTIAEKTS